MTELQEILKIIQFETDKSLTDIAVEVEYARESVSRAYGSGESKKLLSTLKDKFKTQIRQFRLRYPNSAREQSFPDDVNIRVQSFLAVIEDEVARLAEDLKPKGIVKADIEKLVHKVGKTAAGKGKPAGKNK